MKKIKIKEVKNNGDIVLESNISGNFNIPTTNKNSQGVGVRIEKGVIETAFPFVIWEETDCKEEIILDLSDCDESNLKEIWVKTPKGAKKEFSFVINNRRAIVLSERSICVSEEANMDIFVQFPNETFMYKDNEDGRYTYGTEYQFLSDVPRKPWFFAKKVTGHEIGLDIEREFKFITGNFFISKKGNPVFDMRGEKNSHILIKDVWGGAFNKKGYFGRILSKIKNPIKTLRKTSNGGKLGVDYVIIENPWC